jgi:hypothetical protein
VTNQHDKPPPASLGEPESMDTRIELSRHIARLGADRVAEVLGVPMADLEPMLIGSVKPDKARMRRLAGGLGR